MEEIIDFGFIEILKSLLMPSYKVKPHFFKSAFDKNYVSYVLEKINFSKSYPYLKGKLYFKKICFI